IPVDSEDPQSELDLLRDELAAYSEELSRLPFLIGISKTDLLPPDESLPAVTAEAALAVRGFSSATGKGVDELLELLWTMSRKAEESEDEAAEEEEWWTP
ncbi:MAG: hypothetical protein PVF19_12300, partial [Gemmatimonadota bacterium]